MKHLFLFLAMICVGVGHTNAQTTAWDTDKAHSSITFSVPHMVISEVVGRFDDFSVSVRSDKDDFADAAIDVSINTASVNTDNEKRDQHLRSDDFFNAEKYPTIRFVSKKIGKSGDNTYAITGDLTIRDVTKTVTLDGKLGGTITDQRGNRRAGFKISGSLNRFDYGLKWNAAVETGGLVVGETVSFTAHLELIRKK